jgi:predicted PurR-regulated permease PerM
MKFGQLEHSTQVILKVTFVVLALGFLWTIREVITLFLLAVVFASAMDPMADYLSRRKIPRAVSVLAVYIVVLGLIALVVSVLVPVVVDQFRILVNNLPEFANQFQGKYPALYNTFGSPNVSDIFQNILGGGDGEVFSRTVGVFSGLLGFVTVLVISFYLVVADENGMKELIRPLVPAAQQDTVMHLVHRIQKKMGMWVLGQLVLSASIFVLTFVDMPAMIEIIIFLALLEWLTNDEEEMNVVLETLVLGYMTEKIILNNNATQGMKRSFELSKNSLFKLVFI